MGEEGLRQNAMERVTRHFYWEQENRSENAAHIFLKYARSTLFWQIHDNGRERLSALNSILENRLRFNILETLRGGVGEGLQIILQLIKVSTWFADIDGSLDAIKEPLSLIFSTWPVFVSISVCPSFSGFRRFFSSAPLQFLLPRFFFIAKVHQCGFILCNLPRTQNCLTATFRDYVLLRATELRFKSIKTASKTQNDSEVQEARVHKFLRKANGLIFFIDNRQTVL